MTITIPKELAEELRTFLTKLALSPQLVSRDAQVLLDRLEERLDTVHPLDAEPELDPNPLATDEARPLVSYIVKKTGVEPKLIVCFDPGTKHRAPTSYTVLRFWIRDRDGFVATRDLDLREFKNPKEAVKHALRMAQRIVGLDHQGLPFVGKPESDDGNT